MAQRDFRSEGERLLLEGKAAGGVNRVSSHSNQFF